ncbi:hypothetical protein HDF19_20875 [Mucilaginibacter sp. E4BP6]|uniref:hypothetical protein n=1 Tax=Mucilaginibacter sp. E4BP6 TaxID=2723089 RepID=UPI0015C8DAA0|nr:hypothetical protein [Mucilaginibacter sp. E4BP6]NYE68187.1 hypothetical protein [Mucilaginibacter sp. E4BP6]
MKTLMHSIATVKFFLSAIFFLAVPTLIMAQTTYKFSQSPDVTIKVHGSLNDKLELAKRPVLKIAEPKHYHRG